MAVETNNDNSGDSTCPPEPRRSVPRPVRGALTTKLYLSIYIDLADDLSPPQQGRRRPAVLLRPRRLPHDDRGQDVGRKPPPRPQPREIALRRGEQGEGGGKSPISFCTKLSICYF